MSSRRYQNIRPDVMPLLTADWQASPVIAARAAQWAPVTIKHCLRYMAADGMIEAKIDDVMIRGRLQRTNCYRLKQEGEDGDQRESE